MILFKPKYTKKAVGYLRHSREDAQENSVEIQREQIDAFAEKEGIDVLHYEIDRGYSGLTADRPGFQSLFKNWITNPSAPHFDLVLYLDTSRFGRFQNQTEAAYYERICNMHGKEMVAVTRGFRKTEDALSYDLITAIERNVVADFSNKLGVKVKHGSIKISDQGYSAGGTASYGMTRMLLDEKHQPVRILKKGEQKQVSNERVIFVPLNDHTTQTVRDIFTWFTGLWMQPSDISDQLNERHSPAPNGGLWNGSKVINILRNEIYIGTRIYNKTQSMLKTPTKSNPRSEWTIRPDAFDPIVDKSVFGRAQKRLDSMFPAFSRRGINASKRMEKEVRADFRGVLGQGGNYAEHEIEQMLRSMPLVFSVKTLRSSIPYWTVVIDDDMRKFSHVLVVSVVVSRQSLRDQFFLIPIEDLGANNVIEFSEKDAGFRQYVVSEDRMQNVVDDFIKQLETKRPRFVLSQIREPVIVT